MTPFIKGAVFLLCCLAFCTCLRADTTTYSAGKLEWARLQIESPTWKRHANGDPVLLRFITESTTLNMDTTWRSADVENLSQMTAYPFLFSDGLHRVVDPKGLENLQEYIARGGFIFIDSCINTEINPDPDDFLRQEIETLQKIIPGARISTLPASHEIYHNYFDMTDGLPHTYMRNIYNPDWAKHGLYAVYSGSRLCSLISLSGLQCGWAGMNPEPGHQTKCMKMMVNIYVYAVTH